MHAQLTAGTRCRDGAHCFPFRGERDGWEAVLGACRHWQGRLQPAQSQPRRFGCGAWTPAVGLDTTSHR